MTQHNNNPLTKNKAKTQIQNQPQSLTIQRKHQNNNQTNQNTNANQHNKPKPQSNHPNHRNNQITKKIQTTIIYKQRTKYTTTLLNQNYTIHRQTHAIQPPLIP